MDGEWIERVGRGRVTQDTSPQLQITVESVGFGHQDLVFGVVSGPSPLKLPISQSMMSKYYPQGGTVRVSVQAATGALGQPDTYDVGFAVQQEFDIFVTIFYVEPGPPNYTRPRARSFVARLRFRLVRALRRRSSVRRHPCLACRP